MKRIVEGEIVAEWVGKRLKDKFIPPFVAMGVEVDGEIIGGAIFNYYTIQSIDVSVAGSPKAWTPIFLHRLSHYVWNELGCLRVSIITQNPDVAGLVERMGGKPEGVKRNYFGKNKPGYEFGILREEWKLR